MSKLGNEQIRELGNEGISKLGYWEIGELGKETQKSYYHIIL